MASRLAASGVEVTTEGQRVFLRPEGGSAETAMFDLIRDSVVDLGLGLVRVQQRRHALEVVVAHGRQ